MTLFNCQIGALAVCFPCQNGALKRHELIADKTLDEIGQHPVLFRKFEIHTAAPPGPSCRAAFAGRTPQAEESGKKIEGVTLGKPVVYRQV